MGLRDVGQLGVEHAGEGEQVIALVCSATRSGRMRRTSSGSRFANSSTMKRTTSAAWPGPAQPAPERHGSTIE